jgi:uncharacterized protein YndB with AHSA1/START domain
MSETVSLEFALSSPVERVWHALTDSALLSRWMLFDVTDFRAVVGHKFQFRAKPSTGWDGVIDSEVLEVDEPRRLSFTWVLQGQPHHTKVTWTLTGSESGTRLQLEQSGFASDATQEISGAEYGWTQQVDQLKKVLAAS